MRKIIFLALVISLFLVICGTTTFAQKSQRLKTTPKAFQAFYAKFRDAVNSRDKKIVATLTQFPFQYGFDAGDEGKFSKNQFLKSFNDIFDTKRKIFANNNVEFYSLKIGEYSLTDSWDASTFVFRRVGQNYKFSAFIAEP